MSIQTPPALEDGTVVISTDSPRTFLVEDGKRRAIPDEAALVAHGLLANPRVPLPDAEIDPLPTGPVVSGAPRAEAKVRTFLGGGHYMESSATLVASGQLTVFTHTWNITWLSGFTGGVVVTLIDENDVVIAASPEQTFGVDGTMLGRSDRSDTWTAAFPPEVIARTRSIAILHAWAPKVDLLGTVQIILQVGKLISDLLALLNQKGSAGGGQGPELPAPLTA